MLPENKIVYVSPNRSHHYPYAGAMAEGGILGTFISGFPRWRKVPLPLPEQLITRCDGWQTAYLLALRAGLPEGLTEALNLRSKRALDSALNCALRNYRVALCYSGTALDSMRTWKGQRCFIVEAVNSHVAYQYRILNEEADRLGIPRVNPSPAEYQRRLDEYAAADFILCPSRFVADSFREMGHAAEQLLINPYGMPPVQPPCSRPEHDGIRILYVGSLSYRKGLRYLIEAFQQLDWPGKELHIVGPRLDPTGINDLKLTPDMTLHGILKGEALQKAFQQADVFVQPSLEEGLSLVVGEALSHGLPVVATTHTGAGELFKEGEAGFLVAPRDTAALTARLLTLAQDPKLRSQMGQAGREIVAQLGGWRASGERLTALFKNRVLQQAD